MISMRLLTFMGQAPANSLCQWRNIFPHKRSYPIEITQDFVLFFPLDVKSRTINTLGQPSLGTLYDFPWKSANDQIALITFYKWCLFVNILYSACVYERRNMGWFSRRPAAVEGPQTLCLFWQQWVTPRGEKVCECVYFLVWENRSERERWGGQRAGGGGLILCRLIGGAWY